MRPHQKHFVATLESLTVSQEGLFTDLFAKFKGLFDTTPKKLDLAVVGETLDDPAARLAEFDKVVVRYLDKVFPGGKIPESFEMVDGQVLAGTIIQSLWYRGKLDLKNPAAHIDKALSEIKKEVAGFRHEHDKDMRYLNESWARAKKEIGGFMKPSVRQERFETLFEDLKKNFPCHAISYLEKRELHWLGGERTVVSNGHLHFVEDFRTLNEKSLFWSKDVPALTREQAEKLIALFKHIVHEGPTAYSFRSTVKGPDTTDGYGRVFATLEGGDKFLRLMNPHQHELFYNKIISMWCRMQALKAILMWVGRSVKGTSYQAIATA